MTTQPEEVRCCVCGRPATHHLGGRDFCAADFERARRPHTRLARTIVVAVAALAVFSLVVWLLGRYVVQHPAREVLVLVGLILALVPAAFWLWFFYTQDRLEPEPRGYVLAVFFLGVVLTDFIAPRVFDVFALSQWLGQSNLALVLGSMLVKGVVYAFVAWAVVRYTVYPTTEFDERMDGIVYGTAAGLGVATMLNLNYVIDNGGVLLGPGVVNIVVTTLAQASFGGLIGYFLGEDKFEDKPFWWMPAGVGLAAALNGIFLTLSVVVTTAGRFVNELWALALAVVVAALTFAALIMLMRQALRETLAAGPTE